MVLADSLDDREYDIQLDTDSYTHTVIRYDLGGGDVLVKVEQRVASDESLDEVCKLLASMDWTIDWKKF
jgi:hypothetical protein